MGQCKPCLGEGLVTTAAGLAIAISKELDSESLNTLGLFFTILGDNLSLMALQRGLCEQNCSTVV